jgi:hypothetical protein
MLYNRVVTFSVYAELRMLDVIFLVSVLRVFIYVGECLIHTGVFRDLYVPR